jgi:hypothetical protein
VAPNLTLDASNLELRTLSAPSEAPTSTHQFNTLELTTVLITPRSSPSEHLAYFDSNWTAPRTTSTPDQDLMASIRIECSLSTPPPANYASQTATPLAIVLDSQLPA